MACGTLLLLTAWCLRVQEVGADLAELVRSKSPTAFKISPLHCDTCLCVRLFVMCIWVSATDRSADITIEA